MGGTELSTIFYSEGLATTELFCKDEDEVYLNVLAYMPCNVAKLANSGSKTARRSMQECLTFEGES